MVWRLLLHQPSHVGGSRAFVNPTWSEEHVISSNAREQDGGRSAVVKRVS